jgi:hypothetical protein
MGLDMRCGFEVTAGCDAVFCGNGGPCGCRGISVSIREEKTIRKTTAITRTLLSIFYPFPTISSILS